VPDLADLSVTTVIIAIAAMAVGSALQAALGIGMALFAVAVPALVDPAFIPGPMLLAGSLLTIVTAYGEHGAIEARSLRLSVIGLVAGTAGGAIALISRRAPTSLAFSDRSFSLPSCSAFSGHRWR
jgi:hypothetical protein